MKKRKILLIAPNPVGLDDKIAYPPLGLLYVASNLPKDIWDVNVRVMTNDKFDDYNYEHYGVSVHSLAVYKKARELIDNIKLHNHNAKIMVGGSGASLFEDEHNVLVYKGEFEPYVDIREIDKIAFPARELIPYEHIHYKGKVHHSSKPSTTMIATRGCAYNCSFCDRTTLGRKFRKRSVQNVEQEIKLLKKDYKIEHIRFIDDCLTLDNVWFKKFLIMMAHQGVTWTCLSRADLLDNKTLRMMKDCGCSEIFFGFESGSQKLLNAMNKKIKVEDNKKVIQLCKDNGITCCAYMMFGFPGENDKTIDATIKFLEEAKPDKSRLSTFVPIPGTDVWNNPEKYNVTIEKNYEDFWYFDMEHLSIKYNYIEMDKIEKLRTKLVDYYKSKFSENWTS